MEYRKFTPKKKYQQYRAEEHSSLNEITKRNTEYNKWWLQFSRGVNKKHKLYPKKLKILIYDITKK